MLGFLLHSIWQAVKDLQKADSDLTDKAFRQQAEVEAYKVQIAHGAKRHDCARYLAENYWLRIDYATAYALLKDYNGN